LGRREGFIMADTADGLKAGGVVGAVIGAIAGAATGK
jgi:hypothetical protein